MKINKKKAEDLVRFFQMILASFQWDHSCLCYTLTYDIDISKVIEENTLLELAEVVHTAISDEIDLNKTDCELTRVGNYDLRTVIEHICLVTSNPLVPSQNPLTEEKIILKPCQIATKVLITKLMEEILRLQVQQ